LQEITLQPLDDNKDSILYAEVKQAVKLFKNSKSPGTDRVTGELIKAGVEAVLKKLHNLHNGV